MNWPTIVALSVGVVAACSSGDAGSTASIPATTVASTTSASATSTSTTSSSNTAPETSTTRPVFDSLEALVEYRYPGAVGAVIVGVLGPDGDYVVGIGEDGDGRPVDGDRPWPTASTAKLFTAVTVLALAEDGAIDLDAPVTDYLDLDMPEAITVSHLIEHTSGISDRPPTECPDASTLQEVIDLAERTEGPVDTVDYSNTNYLLLGHLIASVTDEDAGDYIRARIFEPVGMASTYWYESQEGPKPWWPMSEAAQGFGLYDCAELGTTFGTDGAAVTTVRDMDAFFRGLFGGELLSAAAVEAMTEMDAELFDSGYGLGIGELVNDQFPGERYFGLGGFAGFFGNLAFHDPVQGRSVVVFTTSGNMETLFWDAVAWANTSTG